MNEIPSESLLNLFRGSLVRLVDTVAPLRNEYRVTVWVNGDPLYYGEFITSDAADHYATEVRKLYAAEKIRGAFVRKERIRYDD